MKTTTSTNVNIRVGWLTLLALILITLKLCGAIKWSWWLVTAPMWGQAVIAFLLAVVIGCVEHLQELRHSRRVSEYAKRRT